MAFILLQNFPHTSLRKLAVMVDEEIKEQYPLLKGIMPIAQIAEESFLSFADEAASTLQKSYGFT